MLWKIYFFILIVLTLPHLLGFIRFWDIVDFIMFVVAMVGLFGFSWQKKIFSQLFWKVFLLLYIGWTIWYSYFLPIPQQVSEVYLKGISQSMFATVSWIPIIPLVFALYLYGFKRAELWKD